MKKLVTCIRFGGVIALSCSGWLPVQAQPGPRADAPGTVVPLNDLSAFTPATPNWQIVGSVRADLSKPNVLQTDKGTGILANIPVSLKKGQTQYGDQYNLKTKFEHGDADIELDFMMAPKSNSGVYLQGRYEVHLNDSWGVIRPAVADNGSVYERWDDKRPDGQNGYEGHAARQNASRAPGLWQHLKISFQAPRFSGQATGGVPQKAENARIIRVELNGVVVQENVELTGPTRSSSFNDEKPTGPLMLQGDHGAVAFRNIRYVSYDKPRPQLIDLKYAVYKGKYEKAPDYATTAPEAEGTTPVLSSTVNRIPNEFLIRYTGTLRVGEPGAYTFNLGAPGGGGMLSINNKQIIAPGQWNASGKTNLPKGDLPFELLYSKFVDWAQPALGLTVAGPGIREYVISDRNGGERESVDPILVDASRNTLLRSFMDIPGDASAAPTTAESKPMRVTHGISVGSPDNVHYTYDLDKGAIVQVWRGDFLDATPMWHERGDGSSRPMGMVQRMGTPVLFLGKLTSPEMAWVSDTTGSGFRPKGYVLDPSDLPTFRYQSYGASVDDKIRVLPDGQGIQREVSVSNPASDLYARLAIGNTISNMNNGMYLVDGTEYVRIDNASGAKPIVRSVGGKQELVLPVKDKVAYSILF